MAESPLEKDVNKEFAKAPPAARAAAGNSIDNYFSALSQQWSMTKEVAKTTGKVVGTAAIVGLAGYAGFLAWGLDAPITQGGLILGDWLAKKKNKEKITAKDTIVKGVAGSVLGGFLHYTFPAVHYIGDALTGAVSSTGLPSFYASATSFTTKTAGFIGGVMPGFIYLENNILYPMLDSNRKPFGKKEFMSAWGSAAKVLGVPAAININFVPKSAQVGGAAVLSTIYGFTSAKPKEAGKAKSPDYTQTATQPLGYSAPSVSR